MIYRWNRVNVAILNISLGICFVIILFINSGQEEIPQNKLIRDDLNINGKFRFYLDDRRLQTEKDDGGNRSRNQTTSLYDPDIDDSVKDAEQENTEMGWKGPSNFNQEVIYRNNPSISSKNDRQQQTDRIILEQDIPKYGISREKYMTIFWNKVNDLVNENELFSENVDVETILDHLRTAKIVKISRFYMHSAFKWMLHFEGGAKAVFKPFWFDVPLTGKYLQSERHCNMGYEQPKSEIAGFYINRLLGTRLAPYTVGRYLSMDTEVWPVADNETREEITKKQLNKFDISYCITFKCWSCRKNETLTSCPKGNKLYGMVKFWMEGRIKTYLNVAEHHRDQLYHNPYFPLSRGIWLVENTYCSTFRSSPPYNNQKVFLDVVDGQIIDFLMAHYDSRYTGLVDENKNVIMSLRLDYGEAFCRRPYHPIHNTLLSIYQCCQLRRRTYDELLALRGGMFEENFKAITQNEIKLPILTNEEMNFVANQIEIVLRLISICEIYKGGLDNVLVNDL